MPGHTPGSVAIRVPAADALFLGDAITTRHVLTGASGARLAPFGDDAEMTRQSSGEAIDAHAGGAAGLEGE
ncbi:MAG: hypothetical protein WAK00_05415 [Microbacterium sp.]|uniref:hypothetical protein n=1 Tax=Microbacterium sp. TaxID=51671 RepID=UPI003BAE7942